MPLFGPSVAKLKEKQDIGGLARVLLRDGDEAVRKDAVKALWVLGDPAAVEPLIAALGDRSYDVRSLAARALGALRDARAVAPLIRMLEDKDSPARILTGLLRYSAAAALGDLNDARAVEPLTAALNDDNGSVRAAAIEALGKIPNPNLIALLVSKFDRMDSQERAAAAGVFKRMNDPNAVKACLIALGDWKGGTRQTAAVVLAELGQVRWKEIIRGDTGDFGRMAQSGLPHASELIALAFKSATGETRRYAAKALGESGDGRAVPLLISALIDEQAASRTVAAEALAALGEARWKELIHGDAGDFMRMGESGHPQAADILIAAAGRPYDPQLRIAALNGLGKCRERKAVGFLIKALSGAPPDLRVAAAAALGEAGDPEAIGPLIGALCHSHAPLRLAAAGALGALGEQMWSEQIRGDAGDFARLGRTRDPRVLEPLAACLRDADPGVRKSAAEGLGELGDPRAADILARALGDSDESVASAAAGALCKMNAVEPLIGALCAPDGRVRLTALGALACMGDPVWVEFGKTGRDQLAKDIVCLRLSRDARLIDPLIRILDGGEPDAKASAVRTLGGFRDDDRARRALISALRDKERYVAYCASNELAGYDSADAREAMQYYYRRQESDAISDSIERLQKKYPDKTIY